jgi:ketosteroid isomerase-like protein
VPQSTAAHRAYIRQRSNASSSSVHEFNFRDGKISRFRAFEDTATVNREWNG